MYYKINDENKIITLWCKDSKELSNIPKNIEEEFQQYRKKKYKICIYQLGTEDIKKNMLKLILNNAY